MERPPVVGSQKFDTDKDLWPVNQPVPKLEAQAQTAGTLTLGTQSLNDTACLSVLAIYTRLSILPTLHSPSTLAYIHSPINALLSTLTYPHSAVTKLCAQRFFFFTLPLPAG